MDSSSAPAGGNREWAADEEGRAGGIFFCGGLLGEGSRQQGQGVSPIKGEAGFIGSAAGYEYAHSPSEHKNKFFPPPQISMQNEIKRGIVSQTRNKNTYPPL